MFSLYFLCLWGVSSLVTVYIAYQKKRNILGYFLLAYLVGPIAVAIILSVPSRAEAKATQPDSVHNLADARREITNLKNILTALQFRLEKLEARLSGLAAAPLTSPTQEPPQPASPGQPPTSIEPQDAESNGLEYVFGKYWLNRIGVVIFVIGIGFFISYTVKYLPAFAKVLLGYLLAAGFLGWGNYLEKKARMVKLSWGILGGGWGLLYLSTYALYFIPATRLVHNSVLAIFLLAVVSVAAVVYNLKYQSWIVTAITFILAFITVKLGGLNNPTLFYWLILTGSVAFIALRQGWTRFFLFAMAACYLTSSLMLPDVSVFVHMTLFGFQMTMALLAINWAVFAVTLIFLKEGKEEDRQLVIAGDLLNAAFFIFSGLYYIDRIRPISICPSDPRVNFLLIFAAVYLALAYFYKRFDKPYRIVAGICTVFTLLGIAALIKYPKPGLSYFWLLEAMVLFCLGWYYRSLSYRIMSAGLAILVFFRILFVDLSSDKICDFAGLALKNNILIFVLAAMCYFILSIWAKYALRQGRLLPEESRVYDFYPAMASVALVALLGDQAPARWLTLSWALVGSAVLGLGFIVEQKSFRWSGLGVLVLAFCHLIISDLSGANTIYRIVAFISLGLVLLVLSFVYSNRMTKK